VGDRWEERRLGDTPYYSRHTPPTAPVPATPCGACGSATECVHAAGRGSIIGTVSELEFRCQSCGLFTAVEERYES
jgi:hypothetical protein